jgi:type I restriction enzyme S subunit
MRKYPKYKASGVEWIGKIPEHWDFQKSKFLTKHISISTYSKEEDETYIALENIESWTGKIILNEEFSGFESTAKKFTENDILFGKLRPYLAKVVMPDFNGICVSEIIVLRPTKLKREYLFFILLNPNFIDFVSQTAEGTKMPRTSWNNIADLKFPFPSIPEQLLIVRFLDHRTGQIDRFVANRQKQIELLKEQKAAIINKAVTKGINPNAKMKPSGIEWIGGEGLLSELIKDEGEFEVIGGNGVMGYTNKYNISGITIAIGRVGAKCGNVHLFTRKVFVNDNAMIIKPFKNIIPEYLSLLLGTMNLNNLSTATAQPLLTSTAIKNQFIGIGSIDDQKQIIEYLTEETYTIDTLISKYQKQIGLMQEYRTSLISQAVTGKIDVRENV